MLHQNAAAIIHLHHFEIIPSPRTVLDRSCDRMGRHALRRRVGDRRDRRRGRRLVRNPGRFPNEAAAGTCGSGRV